MNFFEIVMVNSMVQKKIWNGRDKIRALKNRKRKKVRIKFEIIAQYTVEKIILRIRKNCPNLLKIFWTIMSNVEKNNCYCYFF